MSMMNYLFVILLYIIMHDLLEENFTVESINRLQLKKKGRTYKWN